LTRVLVAPTAVGNLERLVVTHSLPAGTLGRVTRSIEPLTRFPLLGRALEGQWSDFRFVLGPWRWMLMIYAYDEAVDVVTIVTIQDGRTFVAPTGLRR
jgi:hypothetical protein